MRRVGAVSSASGSRNSAGRRFGEPVQAHLVARRENCQQRRPASRGVRFVPGCGWGARAPQTARGASVVASRAGVWGTGDLFFPLKWANRLRELIPGTTTLATLDGARMDF
jgi:hypothetical protein